MASSTPRTSLPKERSRKRTYVHEYLVAILARFFENPRRAFKNRSLWSPRAKRQSDNSHSTTTTFKTGVPKTFTTRLAQDSRPQKTMPTTKMLRQVSSSFPLKSGGDFEASGSNPKANGRGSEGRKRSSRWRRLLINLARHTAFARLNRIGRQQSSATSPTSFTAFARHRHILTHFTVMMTWAF